MIAISPRQLEILAYLNKYTNTYKCSPRHREVSKHFGWTSVQASLGHMRSLTKKGYILPIVAANGAARGYRLTKLGRDALSPRQARVAA